MAKYKTLACEYEAETGKHRFVTALTTPKALHDLMVDREPQRVVIEICSIGGWESSWSNCRNCNDPLETHVKRLLRQSLTTRSILIDLLDPVATARGTDSGHTLLVPTRRNG